MPSSTFRLFRPIALFVAASLFSSLFVTVFAGEPAASETAKSPGVVWHDVREWGAEGRAWADLPRERWFDRLPATANGKVSSSVWKRSRHSAGMAVRFKTDATSIHVDYTLMDPELALSHMPATGVSGVDLYAWDDAEKRWRWVVVTRPGKAHVKSRMVTGLAPGFREYMMFLPLYNGVEELKIGVPKGARFEGLAPRKEKPVVFYGTSITHGACASRPGMAHVAILRRRFDYPVVNLGFSGYGRMDPAVGEFMKAMPAVAFVIDCLPNMNAELVTKRTIPFVKQLRSAQPDTPIVLVEDRRKTNSWILPETDAVHTANHAALRAAFETLQRQGVKSLYYIEGDALYGIDNEGATDGSHANDLGFMRQADVFDPVLRKILQQTGAIR